MAGNKKISVREFVRLNGYSTKRVLFIINKKYSNDDLRTQSQWENQLVEHRVIDRKQVPAEKTTAKSTESEE
jgi:hypothetical protein